MASLLETVYASSPDDEVQISTLEILHPAFDPIRTCAGYEDHTVTLETGEVVTFLASVLDVSLPRRDTSGQQNLKFAIENVTGIAQDAIDRALEAGGEITVVYRDYLASDLSEPAGPPLKMVVVGAEMSETSLQVTCSYQDIVGRAWPNMRYTVSFAPGLRYISA